MSLTRSTLIAGPAHLTFNGYTTHLLDDAKFDLEGSWKDIETSMYGKVDEITDDLLVKISGTPLTYDASTTPAALFPYLTPVPGKLFPTSTDLPAVLLSSNGDVYTAVSGVITKMPDITLGAGSPIFGSMEITGIIGDGLDPETASSYYTLTTGQTYTPVAIDKTKIPRGKYTWVYTGVTGMSATPFEFEEPPVISFDLKIEPIKQQGRTRAFRLQSVMAMLKGRPIGPTAAQVIAAAKLTGVAAASHGHRASANAADLVGTGPAAVTLKNASLKSAGFVFGNKPLRNGEIGFLSTIDTSTGTLGPILTLA